MLASIRVVQAAVLFEEKFDDAAVRDRGWFDSTNVIISNTQSTAGSAGSLEMKFLRGATTPVGLGTSLRRSFTPTESIYIRYFVKYSDNWQGSNRPYQPHEFYILTTADDRWIGPAATRLTAYIEQNEGQLMLAMQDSLNIDTSRIGVDLTNVTEFRGVSGCNGNPYGGSSNCYQMGSSWRNGKEFRSGSVNFSDAPGPDYKGNWHKVEAFIRLNTIVNSKGQRDGVMKLWYDGKLVVNREDVILRTAAHPTMKFNTFLIGPYIGDGSPVEQTFWVDDLLVADQMPGSPPMPPILQSVR